jgi:hypothetical protein
LFKRRRLALLPLVAALGSALAFLVASAPSAPAKSAQVRSGKLAVGVEVLHFSAAGRHLTGTGLVTAKLTDNQGHVDTVHTRVALTAAAGHGCRVLHLYLKQLNLELLGLNAHLDKVVLDLTGHPGGGVLGSLFCKLAHARVAAARASAARALTASVRRHRGDVVRFTANLQPKFTTDQSAGAVCPVLDLVVGPLKLTLLGLEVDLNRVHLSVTATRGAGVLGDLFCQLADNSTTTTTPTTSTSSSSTTTTG